MMNYLYVDEMIKKTCFNEWCEVQNLCLSYESFAVS